MSAAAHSNSSECSILIAVKYVYVSTSVMSDVILSQKTKLDTSVGCQLVRSYVMPLFGWSLIRNYLLRKYLNYLYIEKVYNDINTTIQKTWI